MSTRIVRDCRQAFMGLLDEMMETLDVLRSQLPGSSIWARSSRPRLRAAVMRLMASTTTDPPMVKEEDEMVEAWIEFYAVLLGDSDDEALEVAPPLLSATEAWALFHDGYLSHLETTSRTWATHVVRLDRERFLRNVESYRFYRRAGIDPHAEGAVVDAEQEQRLEEIQDQYEKEVRATDGTNPDKLELRRFFGHDLLAEALHYHRDGDLALAARVALRSQNLPWSPLVDADPLATCRKRVDRFVQSCFFASHLPSPHGNEHLGYRIGLADVVRACGTTPTTMMAIARGDLPWVVDAGHDGRSAAEWRLAELQQTKHEEETFKDDNDRWVKMPNEYGRRDRRQQQSFWLHLADGMRAIGKAHTTPTHGEGTDHLHGELRRARLLPRRSFTMGGDGVGATELHARLDTIAQTLADSSIIARYVESFGSGTRTYPMVKDLLGIYLQLPLLEALRARASPSDADGPALHAVLRVIMGYDTLVSALHMLLTPALEPLLRARYRKRGGERAPILRHGDDDKIWFQQAVMRFVEGGRRRFPPYVLAALEAVRDVLHSGAFGMIDMNHDAGSLATIPWMRREAVEMGVLLLRVRAETLTHLLGGYVHDWQTERGPGSVADSAGIQEPELFTMGVAGSVLRLMSGITIGAGLYGSVLTMCGLEVAPQDRAQFCWLQAMRGGLPGRSVVQLVRLASRYADPYLALGLPLIGPGLALDAQIALYRYLVNLGPERRPALLALLRDQPVLLEWVQWLLTIVDRWTPSRLPRVDVPFPVELCDELSRPPPKRPMLFLNATFFKYALRAELQRAGGRLWLV